MLRFLYKRMANCYREDVATFDAEVFTGKLTSDTFGIEVDKAAPEEKSLAKGHVLVMLSCTRSKSVLIPPCR